MKKLRWITLALTFGIAVAISAGAQASDRNCPNAGLLGSGLMSNFCWDCIFPMRTAGLTSSPPRGDGAGSIPSGALSGAICSCPDPLGLPQPGIPFGAWMPRFITETVQTPYCSPTLGGTSISGKTRMATGGNIEYTHTARDGLVSDTGFVHFHTLSFPILEMLEMFMDASCNPDGMMDIDLQYMSEPDPLWSDSLLAVILSPEALLFTNPAAMLACTAECGRLTRTGGDSGRDGAHWCAGCWGGIYPYNGHANHTGSPVKHSSLIATKALAALHRRLLAFDTVGSTASCEGGVRAPTIKKGQYRFSMFYPSPQADSSHRIGTSTFLWGEHRGKASAGSNHVYAGYRYQDCCLR